MAMTQDQFRKLMGLNKPEPLTGAVATGLNYLKQPLDQYALDSRFPLVGGMTAADFTGITGTQGLVQDFSRGKNIQGDMRMFDALGLVPAIAPAMKLTGKATSALGREVARQIDAGTGVGRYVPDMNQYIVPVGKVARPLTKYEEAFDVAQKRASLPISKGGLGLPTNNTAMDRANAMGFDTDIYRGENSNTNPTNINDYILWASNNPTVANTYAGSNKGVVMPLKTKSSELAKMDYKNREYDSPPYPAVIEYKDTKYTVPQERFNLITDTIGKFSKKLGQKGIEFENINDIGLTREGVNLDKLNDIQGAAYPVSSYAIFDPSLVRSKNAAFDPFRRNESDILAGLGVGIPTTGLLTLDENKKKKTTKK